MVIKLQSFFFSFKNCETTLFGVQKREKRIKKSKLRLDDSHARHNPSASPLRSTAVVAQGRVAASPLHHRRRGFAPALGSNFLSSTFSDFEIMCILLYYSSLSCILFLLFYFSRFDYNIMFVLSIFCLYFFYICVKLVVCFRITA